MTRNVNATEIYRERLAEVRDLIRRLEGSLRIHERRQARQPSNWGFAGDLEHLSARLREITANDTPHRCEWNHPKTTMYGCGRSATICVPDGQLLCGDHAIESDSDPRDCLDLADGTPLDAD